MCRERSRDFTRWFVDRRFEAWKEPSWFTAIAVLSVVSDVATTYTALEAAVTCQSQ